MLATSNGQQNKLATNLISVSSNQVSFNKLCKRFSIDVQIEATILNTVSHLISRTNLVSDPTDEAGKVGDLV